MVTRTRKIAILDLDTQGKVTERKTLPGSEIWLDNTVAGHLYPSLKVALVTVPTEMMEWTRISFLIHNSETSERDNRQCL